MKFGGTNSQFHLTMLHLLFSIFLSSAEPLVETAQGILRGIIQKSRSGKYFSAFLGVPYGQPPIGRLRFANPVPARKWKGILAADSLKSICIQIDENNKTAGDEDCLYLNVYTPVLEFNTQSTRRSKLPVMVWLHGGHFNWGSGSAYGAEYLLDEEVILVTVNYRLAIFGFLCTGDAVVPGNFGMKDQVLAMKWVRDNIEPFGGDPEQVTLFGNSGGAACVALHAISKASTGLFQKHIIQSGSSLTFWAYQKRSNFIGYTRDISTLVNCPWITSEGFLNCMRQQSTEILLQTRSIFTTRYLPVTISWTPTDEPDSEDAFLTDSPENLIANNQMIDLPFIIGFVDVEGLTLYLGLNSTDKVIDIYNKNLDSIIDLIGARYDESLDLRKFRLAVKRFYFNNSPISFNRTAFTEGLIKFTGDAFFLHPQMRLLQLVTPKMKSPNYLYNFGYRGSLSLYSKFANNKLPVGHADELIQFFNFTLFSTTYSDLNMTLKDKFVSSKMVDLWTSFATNGEPTSSALSDCWLPYTTQNTDHLQIGNIKNNKEFTMTMSNDFYTDRMNFWMENFPIAKT